MSVGSVSVEHRGGVAVVTLERPEKRNALSIEMRAGLRDALVELGGDGVTACIVLTGRGSAFCSGLDRRDLVERPAEVAASDAPLSFAAVAECPKPLLAAVNGPAVAGGFALALHCDIRLAAAEAVFGFLGHAKGIAPGYAAARSVLAPGIARDLSLTGRVVSAEEALQLGIVSEVRPAAELLPRTLALAEELAQAPLPMLLETKARFLLEHHATVEPLMRHEERALADLVARAAAAAGGGGGSD